MADKIDRSVEPKLGPGDKKEDDQSDKKKENKNATELSPGVRVRARNKKDTHSKKKVSASPKKDSVKADQKKEDGLLGRKRESDGRGKSCDYSPFGNRSRDC